MCIVVLAVLGLSADQQSAAEAVISEKCWTSASLKHFVEFRQAGDLENAAIFTEVFRGTEERSESFEKHMLHLPLPAHLCILQTINIKPYTFGIQSTLLLIKNLLNKPQKKQNASSWE